MSSGRLSFMSTFRFWFGVGAFIYGIVAVYRIASGAAQPALGTRSTEVIWHVMLWTFAPPLWFAFEATFLCKSNEDWQRLKANQELAGRIWAAVLASILFLVPK